ncbi:MAG TPA: hypothetical protein VIU12_27420 [Chryseolinea sp.]
MIKIAESTLLKTHIYRVCERRLEALIADFKDRIQSLQQTQGLGNDETYGDQTLAVTAQQMSEVEALSQSLDFVSEEMRQLEWVKAASAIVHHVAEPGAVVVTNAGSFFIAIGVGPFEVQGETYVGLSPKRALFTAMQGKKAGDVVHYHGAPYTINNVF